MRVKGGSSRDIAFHKISDLANTQNDVINTTYHTLNQQFIFCLTIRSTKAASNDILAHR